MGSGGRRRISQSATELSSDDWASGPVVVATTFGRRLVGLMGNPGHGLLLRSRSVHGVGLGRSLGLVGLDADGRVVRTGRLRPGALVVWPRVRWIMELPRRVPLPPVGAVLAPWPPVGGEGTPGP